MRKPVLLIATEILWPAPVRALAACAAVCMCMCMPPSCLLQDTVLLLQRSKEDLGRQAAHQAAQVQSLEILTEKVRLLWLPRAPKDNIMHVKANRIYIHWC